MTRKILAYVILTLLAVASLVSPEKVRAQIAVIAHYDVPRDTIDRSTLLDYYTGDIRAWPNEEPIVVLDLESNRDVRSAFYEYLGKTSSRMRSVWMRRKLSGEGDPPEALSTQAEMISRVAATPGAIGFVRAANVDDSVKTLLVVATGEK